MLHLPRFWKHKETNEVIDHLTYSDLKGEPQSEDFNECDVTGELLNQVEENPETVDTNEPEAVETPTETPFVAPVDENGESFVESEVTNENTEENNVVKEEIN